MHLIDLIHSKIELFRLEQRYTRRRNRRSTFVSEAQYVDGEYVYSPTSSYAAKCSAGGGFSSSESEEDAHRGVMVVKEETGNSSMKKDSKSSKRLSKMGLGDWRKGREGTPDRANSRISVREVKWDSRS